MITSPLSALFSWNLTADRVHWKWERILRHCLFHKCSEFENMILNMKHKKWNLIPYIEAKVEFYLKNKYKRYILAVEKRTTIW